MVARKLAVPRRTVWVCEEAVWFPYCAILESRRKKKTCEILVTAFFPHLRVASPLIACCYSQVGVTGFYPL